jgi:hypothetical protein
MLEANGDNMLTQPQLVTLKNDILANPDMNTKPMNADGHQAITDLYNLVNSPVFIVWRTNVNLTEIGDKINAAELAGLTTLNATRLQTIAMYSAGGINTSLADRRAFFDDVFSGAGGTITRPQLLALYKRNALRGERLYATGTGSDASPGTLVVEGNILRDDVELARRM